ncbi:MAG: hypothetical protein AAGD32_14320 [Planctomycetota bacterium]
MSLLDTILGKSKVYVLLAGGLCWLWMRMFAGLLDVPTFEGDSVVLLATPGAAGAAAVVLVGYAVALVIGHVICVRWSRSAGWGCATFGLAAISMRGGPVGDQLLGREPGFFLLMLFELLLLSAVVAVGWLASRQLVGVEANRTGEPDAKKEPIDQKALALVTSAAICTILAMLLARTDLKMQALMAIFTAGTVGAWVAHQSVETRPNAWFWGGPILVGVVGYVAAWLSANPTALAIGEPTGFFAPLARIAPLDYASFGIAGGLLGFSMSREKHAERRAEETQTPTQPAENLTATEAGYAETPRQPGV